MKQIIFFFLVFTFIVHSQPQEYQSRGVKSYLVNYGAINGDPFLARFAARRFVLLDESSSKDIKLVHSFNPNFPILHYKDIVALHASFNEYKTVTLDEHAFIHSSDPSSLTIFIRGDTASMCWLADRRNIDISGYRLYWSLDSTGLWNLLDDTLIANTQFTIRFPKSVRWLMLATELKDKSELNYGTPIKLPSYKKDEPVIAPRILSSTRDSLVRIYLEVENIGDVIPDSVVIVMDTNRDNVLDTLRERTKMMLSGARWTFDKTIPIIDQTYGGYEFFIYTYKNKMRYQFPKQGAYGTNINNRIMNDYYGFYVMDVGSSTWRQSYIKEVLSTFNTQGYNGLFEDDCWYKVERWGVDAFPPIGYDDNTWKKNLFVFLDSIKLAIAPRPAYFNGLYAAQAESLLVHTDGGMTEGFAYTHWSKYVTGAYWKVLCDVGLRAQHLFKKMFLALGGAPYNELESRMYVLGSYLLVADSLSMYANATNYQEFSHFPEFDIPLGKPLESANLTVYDLKKTYAPTNTTYYVRRFELGTVVVNSNPTGYVLYSDAAGKTTPFLFGDSLTGYSTVTGGIVKTLTAPDTIFPKQARIYFNAHALGNILMSPIFLGTTATASQPNPDGSIPLTINATLRDDSRPVFRSDTSKPLWIAAYVGEIGGPKELRLLNDGTTTPGVPSVYSAQCVLPIGTLPKKVQIPILAFSTTGLVSAARVDAVIPNGDSTNRIFNYSYEIDNDEDAIPDYWRPYGKGFDYDTLGLNAKSGRRSVHVKNDSLTEARGVYAYITVNQSVPKDLLLSGWSKAINVSGVKDNDYSLYIDIRYQDDTPLYGQTAQFSTGSHDWEYSSKIIHPVKPIKSLALYALFRKHTGEVWFDHIGLREYTPPNEVVNTYPASDFTLYQNYPNPFSDRTTINLPLLAGEGRGEVVLKVFDIFGREVLDLSDQARINSEIIIDGTRLKRPGVYFYRLTTPAFTQIKTMVLMR